VNGAGLAVFGLGNVLRRDDGFGPAVIRRLEAMSDLPEGVEIRDLGTPGLDLAGYLADFETVVIVDTIAGGVAPGEVMVLDATDHARKAAALRVDTHAAGLREAMWLADLSGRAPKRVWIVGTAAEDLEQGEGLSPHVAKAVDRAAGILRQRFLASPGTVGTCD